MSDADEALDEAIYALLTIRRTLAVYVSGPTNAHTVSILLGVMNALYAVATTTIEKTNELIR